MSNYSSPDFTPQQIAAYLAEYGIASVSPEDILRPTGDFVCSIYAGLLSFLDPLGDDDDEQIDFDALDVVESPEYHSESIRISNFYGKIRSILASIKVELELRDLLRPDPVRTVAILSTVLNFLMYRDEKLANLQLYVDQCNYDRQSELEAKIAELKREFVEHEMACEREKPVVQELEAEVRVLKQTIQDRNKEQAGLKSHYKRVKENIDSINDKISQAEFELLGNAQENSKLLAKIVQSPDRLQRALEEKKLSRSEVKNAERLAMLDVQAKATAHEVCAKACEKISKHLAKVQALQEQANAAKTNDKQVKASKAKLSDEQLSSIALDAKIDELQGKAKQTEELCKMTGKERELRYTEQMQKYNAVKLESKQRRHIQEQREKEVEAIVAKGERISAEATSVGESGKVKQHEALAKAEEVINSFRSYSNVINQFLQKVEAQAERGMFEPEITNRTAEETV